MNEEKKGPGCLKIFLWLMGISAVVIGLITYYVAVNLGDWTRAGSAVVIEKMAEEALKESKLPQAEKQELKQIIDGFVQDIRDEKVTIVQGMAVMGELAAGPLMMQGIAFEMKNRYITYSDLSMEEKQDAVMQVDRLLRGVFENKIDPNELETIIDKTTAEAVDESGDSSNELKTNLSDEDLRVVLTEAKRLADAANIPVEPYTPHLPSVVRQAIERGMSTQSMDDLEKRFGGK